MFKLAAALMAVGLWTGVALAQSGSPDALTQGAPKARAGAPRPPVAASPGAGRADRAAKTAKPAPVRRVVAAKPAVAPAKGAAAVVSDGHRAGLQAAADPLALQSSVALVMDEDTHEVLLSKNPNAVLPIASITKLMTAILVVEAGSPLDEVITITQADVDTEKGSRSRLQVGAKLSRGELLHLALMSSENRAAHALGRTAPGGLDAFVLQMNAKARELGMAHTTYAEPTGLSSRNRSTAQDLLVLVREASRHPLIRDLSTRPQAEVAVGPRRLEFRNTNALIRHPAWDIVLQKTGYISEAGRCVVMQTQLAGRRLILVLLDSAGRAGRTADAERIRVWLARSGTAVSPTS